MTLGQATAVTYLNVTDRERALGFYRDTLGLKVRESDDYGDMLALGAAGLRLTVIPDHKPHAHPVLGWEVEAFDDTARALHDKGVRFTVYEGFGQDEIGVWTSPDGVKKMAWFPDPDGNVLMLSKG